MHATTITPANSRPKRTFIRRFCPRRRPRIPPVIIPPAPPPRRAIATASPWVARPPWTINAVSIGGTSNAPKNRSQLTLVAGTPTRGGTTASLARTLPQKGHARPASAASSPPQLEHFIPDGSSMICIRGGAVGYNSELAESTRTRTGSKLRKALSKGDFKYAAERVWRPHRQRRARSYAPRP